MSGLLGGTSSFVWGKQIKRNIDEKEKALNVAKANDSWRNYVSEDARAGHAYLRRGERDKKALASLPMATAAAGAGRAVRGKPLSGLAVVGGSLALGPAARRQWQEGDRWADKARKIRARGEQRRADGAPVSKAIPFRVVRAAKPYPMRPQRAGAMVRRGPRGAVPERGVGPMSVERILKAVDATVPGGADILVADAVWDEVYPRYIQARDALITKALDPDVLESIRKTVLRAYLRDVNAGGDGVKQGRRPVGRVRSVGDIREVHRADQSRWLGAVRQPRPEWPVLAHGAWHGMDPQALVRNKKRVPGTLTPLLSRAGNTKARPQTTPRTRRWCATGCAGTCLIWCRRRT